MYKSCTTFEYSCENESQRLLKAKKIIKDYIHIFAQLIVVNNQITINVDQQRLVDCPNELWDSLLVNLSEQKLDYHSRIGDILALSLAI